MRIEIHQRRTWLELTGLAALSFSLVCVLLWSLTHD